ncbi:MAG: MFS transporter [Candidatus Eremiobacteraeota bacterium]|nr:MFS transporter [Candidatus Eremiobacteraeota bacterium]
MQFTLSPVRTALGNRTFAAYLVVSVLADCGFWIAIVAQGWLVVRVTHSPVWLGIVGAAAQSPALFMSLIGGIVADRFDRRVAILVTESAIALIALATAYLIARDSLSLIGLCLLSFATGTMLAIEHPIDRAFIYELIDGKDVEQSVALSSVEFSIARTAGPAIGGVAIATIGIAGGYSLQAACVVPIIAFATYALRGRIAEQS